MRTTLKRGVGRGAGPNGNGHSVFPPGPVSPITRYEQPPPPGRSGLVLLRRILVVTVLLVVALAAAVGGGAYIWYHEAVKAVHAHSTGVVYVQNHHELPIPAPNAPATALVVGYDQRAGKEFSTVSRSDTLMLIRTDPVTKTISLLSFPRDLGTEIWCKHKSYGYARINQAYADCGAYGPDGALETVHKLTGIPINYLITVNFHGFTQIVDQFGGIYMDVDRRYYNRNTGSSYDDYANIDLNPGYQLLNGSQALAFVRFRHTDSDFVRLARQQEFIRAFKEQVGQHFNVLDLPKIVSTITKNIEVGGNFDGGKVLSEALLAARLPPGHFIQSTIGSLGVESDGIVTAPTSAIAAAVHSFENPDPSVAKVANATAQGKKLKAKGPQAPAPSKTTVLVLNGNGVAGAAAAGAYRLGLRGYVTVEPPNQLLPNAPRQVFHSIIYYDRAQRGSKAAAAALAKLVPAAEVGPRRPGSFPAALDPGAMLVLILGQTFHNALTPAPVVPVVPAHQPAPVTYDPAPSVALLQPRAKRVPFPLEVPTVVPDGSVPDPSYGDKPVWLYRITPKNKAIRLVYRVGGNEYWGVEETDWADAPILGDKSLQADLNGREFDEYFSGAHLHMIVLHAHGATYWVTNTLLDDLSNETMIAIAKGLKPLDAVK